MQRIHAEEMLEQFTISAYPHLEKEAARRIWDRHYRTLMVLGPPQEMDRAGLNQLKKRFGRRKK